MTWYPDLRNCDYFGQEFADRLLAVGWLARGRSFAKGPVDEATLRKIEALADAAPRIFVLRGFHVCELCDPRPPFQLTDDRGNRVESSSHLNIFVAFGDKLLVAPQCLPHYIESHGYRPPAEFLDAVRNCAAPNSVEFLQSIRAIGGAEFGPR